MNRRHFLLYTSTSTAALLPEWVVAAQPCPPPALDVSGGTASATACGGWASTLAGNNDAVVVGKYAITNGFNNSGASGAGTQTTYVNSASDWQVIATHTDIGNGGAIKSYARVWDGWNSGYGSGTNTLQKNAGVTSGGLSQGGVPVTSITKAQVRVKFTGPKVRSGSSNRWNCTWELDFHTSANPAFNAQAHTSVVIYQRVFDDVGTTKSTIYGGTSLVFLGNRYWYKRTASTSRASGTTVILYPGPFYDYKVFGVEEATFDFKALIADLVVAGNIPSSDYLTGIQCGVEIIGGGAFTWREFQTAINSDADINLPIGTTRFGRLISRGAPVYYTGGNIYSESFANDYDYNTTWRSTSAPSSIIYDLSSVPASERQKVLVAWDCQSCFYYDSNVNNSPYYQTPQTYTIDVHTAAGSGAPPADNSSGWVTVASVTGGEATKETLRANMSGANWIRFRCTAALGGPDITLQMDVFSQPASDATTPAVALIGDSMTCFWAQVAFPQGAGSPVEPDSHADKSAAFHDLFYERTGRHMRMQGFAISGVTASIIEPYITGSKGTWLDTWPGKYVQICLGTNDAGGVSGQTPASATTYFKAIINRALSLGKTVVIPTIYWAPAIPGYDRNAGILDLMTYFDANLWPAYAGNANVVRGLDHQALIAAHPDMISSDQIHPNGYGCISLRAAQAEWWAWFLSSGVTVSNNIARDANGNTFVREYL